MNTVGVTLTVDNAQLKKEFDNDIKLLGDMTRSVDRFNSSAVAGARGAIQAQQEYGKQLGASAEQMRALSEVSSQLDTKVSAAGDRMATATERGARGLSVMAQQGHVTMRSMNQIIASGADIAFAFGPEGTIISAILMVTGGLVSQFESVESKMEEVARKFNEHVTTMLMDGSAKQLGRQAADAYVKELDAEGRMFADAQAALRTHFGLPDMAAQFKAHGFFGGGGADQSDAEKAKQDRLAALATQRDVAHLEVDNPRLDQLKKDRDRLEGEITRLTTKATELEGSGKKNEIAEADRQLKATRDHLAQARAETIALQDHRKSLFLGEAFGTRDPARREALSVRYSNEAEMNPAGEDASQNVARGDAATQAQMSRASARDAAATRAAAVEKRLRDEHIAADKRAGELLGQMQDAAVEHQMQAHGLIDEAEKAAVQKDADRRVREIDSLKISEDRKAELLVAAAEDRTARIEAIERKSRDRLRTEIARDAEAGFREYEKTEAAKQRAVEKSARQMESVGNRMADDLVRGQESMGRRLLKAAMEPEIDKLKGWAKSQFAQAAKDAATQNWIGAAEHFAGGTLLLAGAAEIGALAGGGGGGGGSSGGGGGGGSSSATQLGANSNQSNGPLMVQVVIVRQDENGREISRTAQQLQRLTDRAVPIRVGALR